MFIQKHIYTIWQTGNSSLRKFENFNFPRMRPRKVLNIYNVCNVVTHCWELLVTKVVTIKRIWIHFDTFFNPPNSFLVELGCVNKSGFCWWLSLFIWHILLNINTVYMYISPQYYWHCQPYWPHPGKSVDLAGYLVTIYKYDGHIFKAGY